MAWNSRRYRAGTGWLPVQAVPGTLNPRGSSGDLQVALQPDGTAWAAWSLIDETVYVSRLLD